MINNEKLYVGKGNSTDLKETKKMFQTIRMNNFGLVHLSENEM